jgi:hypothetical protein
MFGPSFSQSRYGQSRMLVPATIVIVGLTVTAQAQLPTTLSSTEPTTKPAAEAQPTAQAASAPVLPLNNGAIAKKVIPARAAATAPTAADAIIAKLEHAKANSQKSISDRKQALLAAIDARITVAADAGKLDTVKSLSALREGADLDGSIPASEKEPSILTAKERYDRAVQTSHLQLASAYKQAIHDLTKARQFDQAEAVQSEFDALAELHQTGNAGPADSTAAVGTELLSTMRGATSNQANGAIVLSGGRIDTDAAFRAPVTFKIRLMTKGDTRIAYAADQIIFNWPYDENQLRIDGGPAGGTSISGKGKIPKDKWVEITLQLLPDSMTIGVDGETRYHGAADFSHVNQSLSILGADCSVESIIVIKGL